MSDQAIELKGSGFTLSVLHIATNQFDDLKLALANKIAQAPKFFEMAPIVANVEQLQDKDVDFSKLKATLENLKLVPVGVTGASDQHKAQAKAAGLAVLSSSKSSQQSETSPVVEKIEVTKEISVPSYVASKVVDVNVRSGQQVYAKETDLIVHGSVGNGGEVIADGSIHIYGKLRGRAIAGAKGDSSARIYCHNIQAELISINGTYWTSEQIQEHSWDQPGCIKLNGEQLSISPLEE